MLTHLQNKLTALKSFSFENELRKIVIENKDQLAALERDQLYSGKDVNDRPITLNGRGYSPFTVKMKLLKGQVVSRVTWKDTGELYKSLRAEIKVSTFSIKSNNFKFAKLVQRSGDEATGLNENSRRIFIMEITRPGILKVYSEKVGSI